MEQDYKKDYSLLRPFDLEAAKRGEAIIDTDGDECNYIAGPHKETAEIVVEFPCDLGFMTCMAQNLRMAPLAWVEGKPVYKGDGPIYSKIAPQSGQVARCDGEWLVIQSGDFEYRTTAENFTWTRPRVKREGFVCIVKTKPNSVTGELPDVIIRNGDIYSTHEDAKAWADRCGDVIAIAPIAWEEPADQGGGEK